MQDEMKDCGVACLQMVIKYYGGYLKKSKLMEMTKTNKNGTTAYHLNDTLIKLGFDSKGVKCNLSDINKNNIILPCIANVIIDNSLKHFIVIYEINYNKKYLIIGDPADKIKKISFSNFEKIFNKVLIIFYPIKTLPIDKDISQTKFLINILKPNKKILVNIFILSIFITIFSILSSFYTEYMINSLNFYSKKSLYFIFCIFFSIYILKLFSEYFRNKSLAFINQKLSLVLTLDIFKNIIKLPYCYYKNKTTGDILSRINDLDSVKEMISKVALSIFVDLPLTILSIILLYFVSKTLFGIGILMIILYFILIILFRGVFNDYIKKIKVKRSEAMSYMVEAISGFETVKGINIENNIISRFEKKYVKLLKENFSYENLYFIQNLFKDLIDNIGFITITLVGCLLVIDGKLELGTLFTFSALLMYFLGPIKNIINLDQTIKESKIALNRVLELVTYEIKDSGLINKFDNGNIEFKNLDFSFNDRDYILKNINLKINKSSKVMVIGKSGSGKSTLFKLLMKYYEAKNNCISISGIDLNKYSNKIIGDNILYIGQQEILFNDTLYNNLVFDSDNSSLILEICKMCYVDEIMDSNLGLNTLIEENGFNISGGERQRIVLARTLLKKFNILIIDEGLSQVDIDLERKILKNIFKHYEDKTIIVISHRFDNMDLFDSVIKFEKGVINNLEKNG